MRNRYVWSIIILIITIAVDQYSKTWGMTLESLHFNQGFIMGIFSELPEGLRIVALAAFAGFVFFLYVFLLYVIPAGARFLKYGLSFLVGGIFGNVIDRLIYGRTVDFIPLTVGESQVVFNVADICQWVGVVLILWMILKKDRLIWHPESSRQNYLIIPKDQLKVAGSFCLVAFATALMLGIFSFGFFRTIMVSAGIISDGLMLSYALTYLILTLLFCGIAFCLGIILSHRSAGAVYAFEQFLAQLMAGKERKLKLRDKDHYKHLEEVAEKITSHFTKKD